MATTTSSTIPTATTVSNFLTQHIIGPLTTQFTPHSDCYLAALLHTTAATTPHTEIGCEIFPGSWCIPPNYVLSSIRIPYKSRCYPSATASDEETFRHFIGPYSPGYHCLDGWTTALRMQPLTSGGHVYRVSDRTLTPNAFFSMRYPSSTLLSQESGAVCCPSGYSFNTLPTSGDLVWCTSSQSTGSLTGFSCWGNAFTGTELTTLTLGVGITHKISIFDPFASIWSTVSYTGASAKFRVAPVQILWKAEDEYPGIITSSTSTRESIAEQTSAKPVSKQPTLSRPAVIGIGVVAGLALIVALIILVLFIRRRRKKERAPAGNDGATGKPELDATPAMGSINAQRLGGTGYTGEVQGACEIGIGRAAGPRNHLVEMDGGAVRAELY